MDVLTVVGYVIVCVVAFLLGSIPCGVIVGKSLYESDPRDGGSGSIGATNVNRLYGWKASLVTFLGDVAKGALAVIFARVAAGFMVFDAPWQLNLLLALAILFVISGHIFCPWLGFRGGKGISTGFGSLLAGFPLIALGILVVFLIVALIAKRVSAGSICAAISVPIFAYVFYGADIPLLVVMTVVAAIVVFAHRGNIKRMVEGTEPKFSFNTSHGTRNDEEA